MGKLLALSLLAALSLTTSAAMTIAKEGQAQCLVVHGNDQTAAEKFALKELVGHLEKMTGAKFKAVSEAEAGAAASAIYLGRTDFARKAGVDFNSLGDEEWLAKTAGDNLILAGGGPRGSLYAVYDFLENQGGCLWMDEHNEFIPSLREFKVAALDSRRKPAFRQRDVFDCLSGNPSTILFKTRNKGFCYADKDMGGHLRFGGPGKGANHTFHTYVKDCPEQDKDKVAGLSTSGKRVFPESATGQQLCWTSQECKDLTLKKLKEYIAQDRREALAGGYPPPVVYDISETDCGQYCCCGRCKELAAREGSYCGPLLDCVNYVAEKIKAECPDIQIRTLAYINTQEPPKTIKPADNVIIQIAVLGIEHCYPGRAARDTMRELTHPNNKDVYDLINRWSKITSKIALYDYWGCGFFENVYTLQPNLSLYKGMNVIDVFGEWHENSFVSLNRWMLYKLLENPDQDSDTLIDKFFAHFYGKAAAPMKDYLRYLTKRQGELRAAPGEVAMINRDYADIEFFGKSLALLGEAEKLADGDARTTANIQRERVPLLFCLLEKWGRFTEAERKSVPFGKEELLNQYGKCANAAIAYYFPPSPSFFPWLDTYPGFRQKMFDRIARNMAILQQGVAKPAELEGKDALDVPLLHIDWSNNNIKIVDDPASAKGKAVMHFGKGLEKERNVAFELYNNIKKEWLAKRYVPLSEAPQDEKYHLYKVGRVPLGKDRCTLAVTESWDITIPVNKILPMAELERNNAYDVYVSAKLQGPKYVRGSAKESALLMDGAYLVKAK